MSAALSLTLLFSSSACLAARGASRDEGIAGSVARRSSVAEVDPACALTSISAPAPFADLLPRMCRQSITFRRQCARVVSATDVSVYVRANLALRSPAGRAWTTFTSVSVTKARADIWVTPGPDATELIAHEFEHVIEWLDGLHRAPWEGPLADGVVLNSRRRVLETQRALQIGKIVTDEVSAAARRDSAGGAK